MGFMKILGFLFIYFQSLDVSAAVDIAGCDANLWRSSVTCNLIHQNVPQFIGASLNGYQSFKLKMNRFHLRLHSIPSQTFANFKGIKHMYLSNIGLQYLNCDIFNSVNDTLETIELNNNALAEIQECSFQNLFSLRYLFLNNNKILYLGESQFYTLYSLEEIHLSGNYITEISYNTFKVLNANKLKYIGLSHNQIYTIHQEAFVQHENLERLDLSYNRLIGDIWKSLSTLKLKYLNLANNRIESVDSAIVNQFDTIEHLDLSKNSIQSLSNVYLRSGVLNWISLSYNSIKSIAADFLSPTKTFSTTSTVTIDISHNILKSLHINLPECKQQCHVYLQNNLLNKLTFSYTGENRVYTINVENNNLTELSDTFPLATVQQLSHNPLSTQSASVFLQTKLKYTSSLHMSNISLFCNKQQNEVEEKQVINSLNISMEIMDFSNNCIKEDFVCLLSPSSRRLRLNFDFNRFNKLPSCMNDFGYNTAISMKYNYIVHINPLTDNNPLAHIDLKGNMIQKIPTRDSVKIEEKLKLNNNKLTSQSNLTFVFMPQTYYSLCTIDLSNNSIDTIDSMHIIHISNSTRKRCYRLRVEISNTSLSLFPNISIQYLSPYGDSKIRLNFQNNSLKDIKTVNVHGNGNIVHIDLLYSDNDIEEISEPLLLLSDNSNKNFFISTIDLSHNSISTYPQCQYLVGNASKVNIEHLILTNNQITSMPRLIEEDTCFMTIMTLYVDRNRIKRIDSIIGEHISKTTWSSLFDLKLSHNAIEFITDMAFIKLDRLAYLDLSSNLLNVVPSSLGTLRNLDQLDLSSNLIKVLPTELGTLQQLRFFYIASNKLTTLPKTLNSLKYLQVLDVSNNYITDFSPAVIRAFVYSLPAIQIKLFNNPLKCSCSTAWLRDFKFHLDDARCFSPREYKGYSVKCFPIHTCNERFAINPTEQTLDMCSSEEGMFDLHININYIDLKGKVLVSWTACQRHNGHKYQVVSKKNGNEIFRSDVLNSNETFYPMMISKADEICVLALNLSLASLYVKCVNLTKTADLNSTSISDKDNTFVENQTAEKQTETRVLTIILATVAAVSICGNVTLIIMHLKTYITKNRMKNDSKQTKRETGYADNVVELEDNEPNTSHNYERSRRPEFVDSAIYEELDREEL